MTSDNKVGINNFQPSAAFHVIESSTDVMRVGTSLISNPTLLVTSNNRVGINHPLPSAAFHVIESSTDPMMIGTYSKVQQLLWLLQAEEWVLILNFQEPV